MIKSKKELSNKTIEIDLTGPEGNAFVLLAYAKNFAKQLGLNFSNIEKEMTSGDYNNLLKVFDNYFGDFVILYR